MGASITVLGKVFEIGTGGSVGDAFRACGYNPGAFLFVVDGRPVPMDSPVEDGWNIKALRVASGG